MLDLKSFSTSSESYRSLSNSCSLESSWDSGMRTMYPPKAPNVRNVFKKTKTDRLAESDEFMNGEYHYHLELVCLKTNKLIH